MPGPGTPMSRIHGFTMFEMIIVMVVVGIVFGLGAIVIGRAFESYDLARRASDVDWQGRMALERMARELRHIRSNAATDLEFSPGLGAPTEVRFIDVDGRPICFRLAGGTVERSEDGPGSACGTTNAQPLADNVIASGLSFAVYDSAGGAPGAVGRVYYISVALQVSRGDISETFRVTVQPRRF